MEPPTTPNVRTGGLSVVASPPRPSLPDSRAGLVCVFQLNARHAYVVPSTHNSIKFGNNTDESLPAVQIRDAKLDIGATTSLFYFSSSSAFVDFVENAPVAEEYPEIGIQYSTKDNESPGGPLITLKMTRVHKFSLCLASDVVTPSIPIVLPHIAFHLCSEDLDALISCTKLPRRVVQTLTQYRTSLQGKIVKRRGWALLGNDINDQFAMFKPKKVFFMCDMNVYNLRSYANLVLDEACVLDMNYLRRSNPENDELHQIEDEIVPSESVDYAEFM